jgi:serine/threonine protein kinase
MEYYEETLQGELNQRRLTSQHFSEPHLWLLIQQLVSPYAYLQHRNTSVGSVCPSNIYLDQYGAVKVNGSDQRSVDFKGDVYCLGMTLIESASLLSSLDLYVNGDIDYVALQARLVHLRAIGYSSLLVNFIKECLQVHEQVRPCFK